MANSHFELEENLWDDNPYIVITEHCELKPITLSVSVGDISTQQTLYVHKCEYKNHHVAYTPEEEQEYLDSKTEEEMQADDNIYFVHN